MVALPFCSSELKKTGSGQPRPADVGLHHELAHADHAQQGTMDRTAATNPNNPHMEEENTIARDNDYRQDRELPTRADHTVL